MQRLMMLHNAGFSAIANLNGFEKAIVWWGKYFKIMVKFVQNTIRSTELSIAYSPCYAFVLMKHNNSINTLTIILYY